MLKRICSLLILLLTSSIAFGQGFVVNKCDVDITLNKEGYFDVIENYNIYFTTSKHGIFRDIITEYKLQTSDGEIEKRILVIKNIEVTGHPFIVSSNFEQRKNGKIKIKIGDKSRMIFGHQHYEIKYRVYNAFIFENDLVEFYWNIKPSGWQALFKQIDFTIHVPKNIPLSAKNCFVYAGKAGNTKPSEDFIYSYSNGVFSAKSQKRSYSIPEPILGEIPGHYPDQEVTVLIKLPKDAIAENFIITPIWQEYIWVGILVLLLLAFWIVWLKYGKDDKVIAATSYYPPKGIDPAMAGYLINDKEDTSDLIALIPHWASHGFITIKEIPKKGFLGKADMKLTRLKSLPKTVPKYEIQMFNSIFDSGSNKVLISSLSNTFYTTMSEAKRTLKKAAQEYYLSQSNSVMKITLVLAVFLGILLFVLFNYMYGPLAAIISTVVCIFIAFMSFYMRKKNRKGNVVFSELKGFRQFIKLAEVNRIKILIEQDTQYFEKTMSYALAFGLLDKWAEKFDALNVSPPNWYVTSGITLMGMSAFAHSFSNSMSQAQSNMVSSPSIGGGSGSSMGGGGFSGGGFGGGGGGSW